MGSGPHLTPGYREWDAGGGSGGVRGYQEWLRQNGYASGSDFLREYRGNEGAMSGGQLINPLTGQPYPAPPNTIPVPGQSTPGGSLPTPIAPPPRIPGPSTGAPAFAPPQVQMPAMLPNPQPQGLGGMPMVRDRMMASTLAPFAQPNWGVPQVPSQYLTQQMPLPGGATAAMASNAPTLGLGGAPLQPAQPTSQIPAGDLGDSMYANFLERFRERQLASGQQGGTGQRIPGFFGSSFPVPPAQSETGARVIPGFFGSSFQMPTQSDNGARVIPGFLGSRFTRPPPSGTAK